VTPPFDENSLPAALRRDHSTKAGVWGVIRVLKGRLMLRFADSCADQLLEPGRPGRVAPQQVHHVEPLGPIRMQVEFYDRDPGEIR
jgi:hemoglobin